MPGRFAPSLLMKPPLLLREAKCVQTDSLSMDGLLSENMDEPMHKHAGVV